MSGKRKALGVSLLVVGVAFLALAIFTAETNPDFFPFTGKASNSTLFLCVNELPSLNLSACLTTINQSTSIADNTHYCFLNMSDPNGNGLSVSVNTTNNVSQIDPWTNESWFWLSGNNLVLRPRQDEVGEVDFEIVITDDSPCINNMASFDYNITVLDVNDPPELYEYIPDVSLPLYLSISPFSLYDYFRDPDLDDLTFSFYGSALVDISIIQSSGRAIFYADQCGEDVVFFRATDPYNLTAESNLVFINVSCDNDDNKPSPEIGEGGSGGGGGSSFTCEPKWECKPWSECLINGSRSRRCTDVNACDIENYVKYFWEECEYIPTCFDGVQNGDEEGVDCGGKCSPCGTCYDGIMNNDEEDIDCGGTYCEACHNCFDGIMNWDEEGVDCGGAFCAPCPTCFDGVQNQDETGIDCGGSCPRCSILETPGLIIGDSPLTMFILLFTALALTLLFIFRFYHTKIIHALAALGVLFKKRRQRKQILLPNDVKVNLLKAIRSFQYDAKHKVKGVPQLVERLVHLTRNIMVLTHKLPFVFDEKDFTLANDKLVRNEDWKFVLASFMKKMFQLEQSMTRMTYAECILIAEELRSIIFQMSEVHETDYKHKADEIVLDGSDLKKCRASLYNIYLSLEFEHPIVAKRHYGILLNHYELLSEDEKKLIYPDIIRAYHAILYLAYWVV